MKTKLKIALAIGAVIVIAGAGGAEVINHHNTQVQAAKQDLSKAKQRLTSNQGDLLEAKAQLENDESSSESNFDVLYSQTHFTKKQTIVLPQNPNYKVNEAAATKWFLTYANEVRKLNGNNTPFVSSAGSAEQSLANSLEQESSVTLSGSEQFDILGFSGIGNTAAVPQKMESDQQLAYQTVMALYDSTDTDSGVGYAGRAYLLYDGPNIGLSFSPDQTIVFEQNLSAAYNAMVKTTTTPQTVALPDITFAYVNQKTLTADKEKIAAEQVKVAQVQQAVQADERKLASVRKSIF